MLRIAIYVRVSTEEQERGVSLEDQERRCRCWVEAMGHQVTGVYTDIKSGSVLPNERELSHAMRSCEDGISDGIVAVSLDRFSRNLRHTLDLIDWSNRHRYNLVSLRESLDTQSAAGRMLVSVLGAMHQFTLESISEKTKGALAHLKKMGKVYGVCPWGYRADAGQLVVNYQEVRLAESLVRILRSHPRTSYPTLAAEVSKWLPRHPRSGKNWKACDIGRVVRTLNWKGFIPDACMPLRSRAADGKMRDANLDPTGEWATWVLDPAELLDTESRRQPKAPRVTEGPGVAAITEALKEEPS